MESVYVATCHPNLCLPLTPYGADRHSLSALVYLWFHGITLLSFHRNQFVDTREATSLYNLFNLSQNKVEL